MRIFVNSSLPSTFNIGNATYGTLKSLGFRSCIDHTNAVVYTMMQMTPQPKQPPYYAAYFALDAGKHTNHTCRFLASHWTSGNVVRVYQQDALNCSSSYVASQLPGPDGVTNVAVHIA